MPKTNSTYPFNRGYDPEKLHVDSIWKQSDEVASPINHDKPKVVLRNASEVLVRDGYSNCTTSYRMPPGTSRTRKCQETYESVLAKEKKV